MIGCPVLIDSNLLILFVVGTASKQYIARHKRLSAFTAEDYDTLLTVISRASAVIVTPNTLTETSNLATQIAEPARTEILQVFRAVVANTQETYIPSTAATERQEFIRLGLTDAALIEVTSPEIAILTTDLDLYLATLKNGNPAINFNHLRDRYL